MKNVVLIMSVVGLVPAVQSQIITQPVSVPVANAPVAVAPAAAVTTPPVTVPMAPVASTSVQLSAGMVAPGLVKQPFMADPAGAHIRRHDGSYDAAGNPQTVFLMRNGLAFGEKHGPQVRAIIEQNLLRPGEVLLTHPGGWWYVVPVAISPVATVPVAVAPSAAITPTAAAPATVSGSPSFELEPHNHPTLGPIFFFKGSQGKASGQGSIPLVQTAAGGRQVLVIPEGHLGTGLLYVK